MPKSYPTINRYFSTDGDGDEKVRRELLPEAETGEYGAVKVTDDIVGNADNRDPSIVPSAKAIADYVADYSSNIFVDDKEAIPYATTTSKGLVRLADDIDDTPEDTLVTTVKVIRDAFFDSEGMIREELLPNKEQSIEYATRFVKGLVQFANSINDVPEKEERAVSTRLLKGLLFDEHTGKLRIQLLPDFQGAKGEDGKDGGYWTPHVDDDGNLVWSNTMGLPNPAPVSLRGADGDGATVKSGTVSVSTGHDKTSVKVANRGTDKDAIFDFSFEFGGNIGSGSGASEIYTSQDPTTSKVGGVPAGWKAPADGISCAELLYMILHDYMAPSFSSFALVGQATTVEVGTDVPENLKFSYGLNYPDNVKKDSIQIVESTASNKVVADKVSASPVTSTSTAFPGPNDAQTKTFVIKGTNTKDAAMGTKSVSINWQWRMYWGETSMEDGSEAIIKAARTSKLAPNRNGTLTFVAGGYKFFAYPKSWGKANKVINPSNNFDIALCEPVEIEVTNDLGKTTTYYYYRSYNVLGDAISFAIS